MKTLSIFDVHTHAAGVCYSFFFRRPIQVCGTSTQSVKMSQRTTTSLHQVSSGNMVHGLNAVLHVEQVKETTLAIDTTLISKMLRC